MVFISTVYVRVWTPRGAFRGALAALAVAALTLALVAAASRAAPLDGLVSRALAGAGGASGAYVLDTTTGQPLAAVRADVRRMPASVEKLYTTSTALLRFGAAGTLTTAVLGTGSLDATGAWNGDLYLRGGGDPTFGTSTFTQRTYGGGASVATLAAAVRTAGVQRVTGVVYGDESWLDRLRGGPTTGFGLDVTELGGPLGALLFNRGLQREDRLTPQARPAKFAARQLALALRSIGVAVDARRVGERRTPAGAQPLATVASPPMATLVRLTLAPSDNLLAETLLKDLGAAYGAGGSTAGGVAVVRRTVGRFHIRPAIVDGSGLSRADRTSPREVVTLLAALRDLPGLRGGLAVPGQPGTLEKRMRHTPAQRRCQAKTGTLSDVSALAGYCTTADGHIIAFAFMENGVWPLRAKAVEDRLTIRLARWRASAPQPAPGPPPAPSPGSGGGAPPPSSP